MRWGGSVAIGGFHVLPWLSLSVAALSPEGLYRERVAAGPGLGPRAPRINI